MDLNNYYSLAEDTFQFTRQQASQFAKNIAGDFNPIHDQDNKRFCVPGDLLFAMVLKHYGISEQMKFEFGGMVSDLVPLHFKTGDENQVTICDAKDKAYLTIHRSGENTENAELINNLVQTYVGFSGQTFPHILVPLMEKHHVMINPDRPLVIYNSMMIQINNLAIQNPELKLVDSDLTISGKRGDVCLKFEIMENGEIAGTGEKNMVLSSLREYEADKIAQVVETYNTRKATITE